MKTQKYLCTLAFAIGWVVAAIPAGAAPVLAAPYDTSYSIFNLNSVPGVPGPYGGLTLEQGDPNTLLIGGDANNQAGAIYSIGVTRDASGHISGFSGTATPFASAPHIDGGLAYGPSGVLFYTAYPNNQVGEIKPGSTSPDKVIDLTPLGIVSSVGTLAFVPAGQPGAGGFKIASFTGGQFYNATLSPDGSGTYNITSATQTAVVPTGEPEGIGYVPTGSPLFSQPSLLLSEFRGNVGAYTLDPDGNPIVSSRKDFITGLVGAQGAFIDPLTGDALFSTFGGGGVLNQIIEVRGFAAVVPEPSTLVMGSIAGLVGLAVVGRRAGQRASNS
ncbi:MAG: hypothetical protein JOZ53_09515 [Planctomycetaceae bacterium]|nr:hypothetical protein [Planctomycetaceae bacterium]